jgi:hypothetical protein
MCIGKIALKVQSRTAVSIYFSYVPIDSEPPSTDKAEENFPMNQFTVLVLF